MFRRLSEGFGAFLGGMNPSNLLCRFLCFCKRREESSAFLRNGVYSEHKCKLWTEVMYLSRFLRGQVAEIESDVSMMGSRCLELIG